MYLLHFNVLPLAKQSAEEIESYQEVKRWEMTQPLVSSVNLRQRARAGANMNRSFQNYYFDVLHCLLCWRNQGAEKRMCLGIY